LVLLRIDRTALHAFLAFAVGFVSTDALLPKQPIKARAVRSFHHLIQYFPA
jgi:hypothetical protein